MKRTILSALVAAAALSAGELNAQYSDNAGFFLNAHLSGTALSGTGSEAVTENGGGAGFAVGYGFNDRIVLFFNLDAAEVEYDEDFVAAPDETYSLLTGDLGVRVNLGNETMKVRPYINAAFTGVASVEDYGEAEAGEDIEEIISGGGVTIGGGVQYFFSRTIALDLGLQATAGAFTEITFDGEDEEFEEGVAFTSSRVQLGVSWHP